MLLFIQETFGESGSNREHLNVAQARLRIREHIAHQEELQASRD